MMHDVSRPRACAACRGGPARGPSVDRDGLDGSADEANTHRRSNHPSADTATTTSSQDSAFFSVKRSATAMRRSLAADVRPPWLQRTWVAMCGTAGAAMSVDTATWSQVRSLGKSAPQWGHRRCAIRSSVGSVGSARASFSSLQHKATKPQQLSPSAAGALHRARPRAGRPAHPAASGSGDRRPRRSGRAPAGSRCPTSRSRLPGFALARWTLRWP